MAGQIFPAPAQKLENEKPDGLAAGEIQIVYTACAKWKTIIVGSGHAELKKTIEINLLGE